MTITCLCTEGRLAPLGCIQRAEIERLRVLNADLTTDVHELRKEVEHLCSVALALRALNAELVAALKDAVSMIEVVCAPIAAAHLRAKATPHPSRSDNA